MAVEGYRRFVRRHQALLAVLESAVTTVTWLLPDRFAENEFTLEGIHTVANLVSVFHDSILNDVNDGAPKGAQELTLALNALQQVEVLVELYAVHSTKRNGKRKVNRYDALLVVEALKALVRLAIYHKSGRRMLLHGGAEGMFDPANGAREVESGIDGVKGSAVRSSSSKARMVLKGFQAFREARTPLVKDERLKTIEDAMERAMEQANKRLYTGEMLHVLRPVAYVAMLRVWGIKSWKPWLIGLVVELLSIEATKSAWTTSNDAAVSAARELAASTGSSIASLYAKQGMRLDSCDVDEITRRKVRLLLYLIRDPLFSRRTQPVLQACVRATSRVPLLSSLVSFPVTLLEGIQRYYTYTSGN
jgi:peroxin-16